MLGQIGEERKEEKKKRKEEKKKRKKKKKKKGMDGYDFVWITMGLYGY